MSTEQLLARRYRLLGKDAPLFYDEPLTIVKGEGVWLYDADGKRYLDAYNNVPSVGHCHPRVVEALCRQAATLNVHTRYLHETILDYGERLTALLDDSLSMLFLTCTGSEANEAALRIARHQGNGQGIICTNATYHGNTAAVYALTTFIDGKPQGPGVKAVNFPDTYRTPYELSGQALEDAYVDEVRQAIAAFEQEGIGFAGMLLCPIFANEGLPDVPPGYLPRITKLVRDAGGLLIFDEVQAGFGRTGKMWGHQHSGVVPDLVVLGKPMGNGHPLGGVVCRPDLGNAFRKDTMYFNTFGGNPVSCAVGMAVLDVIEQEGLVENSRQVGAYLKQGLQTLSEQFELFGDVRGCGLFAGVEMVTDRQLKTPAPAQANRLINLMKEHRVLMGRIGLHGNIIKVRPPLCFSEENADLLLTQLEQALKQL